MTSSSTPLAQNLICDLLVVGSGAGGLATAITAKKHGLDVVVIEKAPVFGGTTAFSGGVLWIPGSHHDRRADSREAMLTYMKDQTGEFFDEAAVTAFLDHGPAMVDWFERETAVKFVPTLYPDYHPDAPGGAPVGRSILAAPFDASALGKELARLRPPLETITFVGMMFNSSNADLKHFFRATKSLVSAAYVARRLAAHFIDLLRYRRGVQVTSGNALAARLAKSCFDLGIPIHTGVQTHELLTQGGRVTGARLTLQGREVRVAARRGVVLACGGYAHDLARTAQRYPHLARGGEHLSPVPKDNTGDGLALAEALAEALGGQVDSRFAGTGAAAWMPVSRVPLPGGRTGVFPHLLDRYKPGVIGVLRDGRRFTNESNSYHDVGAAMIEACAGQKETAMWLVCDQATISRYGLGYAKPAPMPLGGLIRQGYLFKGRTLAELAQAAGIDAAGLEATVREFNTGARAGVDAQFGRGSTAFNRYLADPEHQPNPCVAPVAQGPFYAVKLLMGDLGTFDGLRTSVQGEVLREGGTAVPGLYAVGNDRGSIMGGNYPGAGITLGPAMVFGWLTARHIAGLQDETGSTAATDKELRHVA
ncbi:FAD-dependent oxidoreductase [Xenophilus arseniciresistens]|uniref:FAD-dependent oxidoreductase n=1 Tax=Xenophilus arseniciresistens TaxID=1283306 RepID=A0AAE3NDX2_9BURK|nr:FAD-dependent oxidoreductase [Xenophilus arseniciresistens]MDA7418482.1 FAD-dependent oxidoreductase [Xenophilus arseniciresistens]